MPAAVKTEADEKKWQEAKRQAKKQGHAENYAYVMSIFQNMKKADRIPGGLADKKKPEDFDPKCLAEGIKVEREHTKDPQLASEIARDHLVEDKDYYKKLAQMETKKAMTTKQGVRLRFKELERKIERQGGAADPAAVAAKIYHEAGGEPTRKSLTDSLDQWLSKCETPGRPMTKKSPEKVEKKKSKEQTVAKAVDVTPEKREEPMTEKKEVVQPPVQKSESTARIRATTLHLDQDQEIAKSLEAEDVQIGVTNVPGQPKLRKGTIYEGESIKPVEFPGNFADKREQMMRDLLSGQIREYDPDGTNGQGGLAEWFAITYKDQPNINVPLALIKAKEKPTIVIDDSDPYIRQTHRMSTNDSGSGIDCLYHRKDL